MIRAQFVHCPNRWSEAREAGCAKQTDNGAQTEPHDMRGQEFALRRRDLRNRPRAIPEATNKTVPGSGTDVCVGENC